MKFALFDAVEVTEATTLAEGQVMPASAHGAIVEVFDQGGAYFVEVFGEWVTAHPGRQAGVSPTGRTSGFYGNAGRCLHLA